MSETIVCFHAHPDDEALLTAGTMAKAAAAGRRVVCVFATNGEAGDASQEFQADLASRRQAEARDAAAVLGVARVEFLGFADSGSDGHNADGFAFVDVDVAAIQLAEFLRGEEAQVLTTYDARGGYGHPDHVQVHRVGRRAAELAGTPYVYEATVNRDLFTLGIQTAAAMGIAIPEGVDAARFADSYSAPAEITTTIDVGAFIDRKRAALRAHHSQSTSADGVDRTIAMLSELPDELFALGFGTEWFIARADDPGDPLAELV